MATEVVFNLTLLMKISQDHFDISSNFYLRQSGSKSSLFAGEAFFLFGRRLWRWDLGQGKKD